MAEGLKVMALEGHGIAFLPYSAVQKELRAQAGELGAAGAAGLEIAMEVRAHRGRPSGKQPAKGTAQALWAFLADAARDGRCPGPDASARLQRWHATGHKPCLPVPPRA